MENLQVTVLYLTGVRLSFTRSNECSSLPWDISIGGDKTKWATQRSIKSHENISEEEDIYTKTASSNNQAADNSSCNQTMAPKTSTNQLSDQATSTNFVMGSEIGGKGWSDVKPKLKSYNAPTSLADLPGDKAGFKDDFYLAGFLDDLDEQQSQSEMKLQSLPMTAMNFTHSYHKGKPPKEKVMQRQERIKQFLKSRRGDKDENERGHINSYNSDKNGIEPNVPDAEVSIGHSLPSPNVDFARKTERKFDVHFGTSHTNESNRENLSLTIGKKHQNNAHSLSTEDSVWASRNKRYNSKSTSKDLADIDRGNEDQNELSLEHDTRSPSPQATSSKFATGKESPQSLETNKINLLSNSQTTHSSSSQEFLSASEHFSDSDSTKRTAQLDRNHDNGCGISNEGTSNLSSTERHTSTRISKECERFEPTSQRENGSTKHNQMTVQNEQTGNTTPHYLEGVLECDGEDDTDDNCRREEEEALEDLATTNQKPVNVAGGHTRINEGERKAREMLKRFNLDDDYSQSSKENLEQLRQINKALKDSKLCKVCRDKDANRLFLPCAHLACCSLCSPAVQNCPQCKSNIRGVVSVYFG